MTKLNTMRAWPLLVLLTGLGLGWGSTLAAQDGCKPTTGWMLYQQYDRQGWLGVTMADVAACATELTSASALVSAIEHVRDPRIVRLLIDAGADLHQDGNPTPIDMLYNAIERTDNPSVVLGIVGVLLDAYVDLSEGEYLHQALRNHGDHVALISLLLSRGADPNRITQFLSLTPLHVAADHTENPAVIRTLIDYGANPNTQTISYRLDPPLNNAIGRCNLGLVRALLEGGADPNGMNQFDPFRSPLQLAEAECYGSAQTGIIETLLTAGARDD